MEYFETTGQSRPRLPPIPCLITADTKLPEDARSFHAYPRRAGWKLHHDYRLEINSSRPTLQDLASFLQSWLFFGLVAVTLQTNGHPILQASELHDDMYLSTGKLPSAVRTWVEWERTGSPEERQLRLASNAYILSTARQVVRRNFSLDILSRCVGYSTSKTDYHYVSDELALFLMVLGETLSAASKRLIEDTTARTQIPSVDLAAGWGPSRWVFKRMVDGQWCPNDIHRLHIQFGPNATPLLSEYMHATSVGSASPPLQHVECTEYVCKVKKAKRVHGSRSVDCLADCPRAYDGGCEMIGPNMGTIVNILESNTNFSHSPKIGPRIPMLQFRSTIPDQLESIELEVHELKTDMNEFSVESFVTVSHVWNDDWNSFQDNKLSSCRLQMLRRIIRKLSPEKDMLFWMDTLIVPQTGRLARKEAIRQICQVFRLASHTIVLEPSSLSSADVRSPDQAAMSTLSHAWMRRLWTLQESYLTPASRSHSYGDSFTELRGSLDQFTNSRNNLPSSSKTSQVHGITSYLRTGKDPSESFKEPVSLNAKRRTILVANAWRAARWRVSQPTCPPTN